MHQLISSYANGLDCERGAKAALGVGLKQLDRYWKRDVLAENVFLTAINNLLPWLVLLAATLTVPVVLIIRRMRSRPTRLSTGSQATAE
jgi:hypothetical protein